MGRRSLAVREVNLDSRSVAPSPMMMSCARAAARLAKRLPIARRYVARRPPEFDGLGAEDRGQARTRHGHDDLQDEGPDLTRGGSWYAVQWRPKATGRSLPRLLQGPGRKRAEQGGFIAGRRPAGRQSNRPVAHGLRGRDRPTPDFSRRLPTACRQDTSLRPDTLDHGPGPAASHKPGPCSTIAPGSLPVSTAT